MCKCQAQKEGRAQRFPGTVTPGRGRQRKTQDPRNLSHLAKNQTFSFTRGSETTKRRVGDACAVALTPGWTKQPSPTPSCEPTRLPPERGQEARSALGCWQEAGFWVQRAEQWAAVGSRLRRQTSLATGEGRRRVREPRCGDRISRRAAFDCTHFSNSAKRHLDVMSLCITLPQVA